MMTLATCGEPSGRICAEIGYVLIEKPLQRLGRKIADNLGGRTVAEPVTSAQVSG
jgi:hypothetical protein